MKLYLIGVMEYDFFYFLNGWRHVTNPPYTSSKFKNNPPNYSFKIKTKNTVTYECLYIIEVYFILIAHLVGFMKIMQEKYNYNRLCCTYYRCWE